MTLSARSSAFLSSALGPIS